MLNESNRDSVSCKQERPKFRLIKTLNIKEYIGYISQMKTVQTATTI